jgi:class 3 adenylate cyclase
MESEKSPNLAKSPRGGAQRGNYMLPGMKKVSTRSIERKRQEKTGKKKGSRLSTFNANIWKKRGGGVAKQNKKIPQVGGNELVNTVFLDTSAVESKLSESSEEGMLGADETTILSKKLSYDYDFYLFELPLANAFIVIFGIIKNLVMIPDRKDGSCYVSAKEYLPVEDFDTIPEYCAQQTNVLYFLIPVIIQFFMVGLYLSLRHTRHLTKASDAKTFAFIFVCSHVFLYELIAFTFGLYHFMEGLILIWLVGFTYRLQHLSFREKNLVVFAHNMFHLILILCARFDVRRNKESWSSMGRTVGYPALVSGLLVFVNLQKDVGQKLHKIQATGLRRKYRVLEAQVKTTEKLLQCVLPKEIISTVKTMSQTKGSRYCVSYSQVTIMFAKICGIHEMFEELPTVEVVGQLDALFKLIDNTTDTFSIEKIKTVGDTYMCASGLPTPHPDHAYNMANFAFALADRVVSFNHHGTLDYKIGMCIGKIVAGVIGKTKFTYDIWGDAANTASRMYSCGVKHKIQCPKETADKIKDRFQVERRGIVNVKGKGDMDCWFIVEAKKQYQQAVTSSTSVENYKKMNMNVENIRSKSGGKKHRQSTANNRLALLIDNADSSSWVSMMSDNKNELIVDKKQWVSDILKTCQKCGDNFTMTNRRHHCRYCGLLLCQDCSKWKIDKKRACKDCKELYEEAKDRNEFLRKLAEDKKKDKQKRAKRNLVSSVPWKACIECVRSGTSRKLEREFLAHKKNLIDNKLTFYWLLLLMFTYVGNFMIIKLLQNSCIDVIRDIKPGGMFDSDRSPCESGAAGVIRIGVVKREMESLARESILMNNTVKQLVSLYMDQDANSTGPVITRITRTGREAFYLQSDIAYSWSVSPHMIPWPDMEYKIGLANLLNTFILFPLTIVWILLSKKLDYEILWDTSEFSRPTWCPCWGGPLVYIFNDLVKFFVIHSEQVATALVAILMVACLLFETFYCHFFYGYLLVIVLYGLNTYSVVEHGIVFIITFICALIMLLSFVLFLLPVSNGHNYELKERLQFIVFFFISVTPVLIQGHAVDHDTRKSFLKSEILTALKDVSQKEREKNIAMLPLPSMISEGLQKGKNIVIDAFGTVLFADIVSFTVFSSSDVLAPIPENRPKKLVEILNVMFSQHDALAERCGVDKVKTLGDCYVASCGLLAPTANHASLLTKFGLGMHGVMGTLNDTFKLRGKGPKGKDLRIRVGLASGTVVGGVVGGKKFIFDIWGDTVETAEIMESEGIPEEVHISHSSYLRARKDRDLEFTERKDQDLSSMGYNDKSYIARPRNNKFKGGGGDINEWIDSIFPDSNTALEETKEDVGEKRPAKRRQSIHGGGDMDFHDNPISRKKSAHGRRETRMVNG